MSGISRVVSALSLVVLLGGFAPALASPRSHRPVTPGQQLWEQSYSDPAQSNAAWSEVMSPDQSRVFVTGDSYDLQDKVMTTTIAYDAATGAQVWVQSFSGGGGSVAISPDGRKVIVAASSHHPVSQDDITTVAYRAQDGAMLWNARYDDPIHGEDSPSAVAVSPDGSAAVVTGFTQDAGGNGWTTIAYGLTTGTQLWAAQVAPSFHHYMSPCCVAITSTGVVLVAGSESNYGQTKGTFLTIAYGLRSGRARWSANNPPGIQGKGGVLTLATSPDGATAFATGGLPDVAGHYAATTVAYDVATGVVDWQAVYDPAGFLGSDVFGTAVTPDGADVLLEGMVADSDQVNTSEATVDYDAATGQLRWAVTGNDGEDTAFGERIAIAPDGTTAYAAARTCTFPECESSAYNWILQARSVADGAVQWSATHQHVPDGGSRVAGVVAGSAEVVTTGDDNDINGHDSFTTIAWSTT